MSLSPLPLAGRLARSAVRAALAHAVSRWLTRPRRGRPDRTPADLGLSFDRARCETACGLPLAGWVVTPPRPRGTAALFHGFRRSRVHMLDRLALLAAAGWRCVAFDHRAHGESGGRACSFGFHERDDVAAVRGLIARAWPGGPAAAVGVSMGAAALCYAAGLGVRWDAAVLESVYDDILSTFRRRVGGPYPAWIGPLVPDVVRVTERRLGVRFEDLTPADWHAGLAPTPLLFVHGTDDAFAPAACPGRMRDAYPASAEVMLVPGAGHSDVFEAAGPGYARTVLDFLARHTA